MAEEDKPAKEKKKKKKSYFFQNILLFLILIITLVGGTVFLDIIGFINLSMFIAPDSQIGRLPYIGKYIEFSYISHLSEEEKIKTESDRYQEILESRRRELSLMEEELAAREKDVVKREALLKENETKNASIQKEMKTRLEELDSLKKEYQGKSVNIQKIAAVYAKMDPELAAKVLEKVDASVTAQIFEKMEDKQVSKLMDSLSNLNSVKAKEIIETMTRKGVAK